MFQPGCRALNVIKRQQHEMASIIIKYFFRVMPVFHFFEAASSESIKTAGMALSSRARIDNNKKTNTAMRDFFSNTKYMALNNNRADKQSGEEHRTTSHMGAEIMARELTAMASMNGKYFFSQKSNKDPIRK